jgi:hypothetical protein
MGIILCEPQANRKPTTYKRKIMSDFRPAPRKKNALDNRKLHLSAPCPTAKGKWSSLQVNVFTAEKTGEPNPRITVYTRDPEDQGESKNYGKIQANLDPQVFFALMVKLRWICEGPTGAEATVPAGAEDKMKMENKNFIFPGGRKSEEPVAVSEIHMGKDAEGCVWISITAKDRPRIKFVFGPNQFHTLFHRTGEQFSKGEASVLWALGWIKLMEEMIPPFLISNYVDVPYDPTAGKGGGGGGGYNRGGGNNYGGNRGGGGGGGEREYKSGSMSGGDAIAGAEDDIPW